MAAADNFRVNLRAAMRARRETMRSLGAKLGTSHAYVNNVVHGHVMPGLDQCDRLASALGFQLAWMLEDPVKFAEALGAPVLVEAAT